MRLQTQSTSRLLDLAAGSLLGVVLILLLRRYAGITHDSVLYLGQSLLHRWPEIYSHDLFFLHGSQDRYSVFPRLLTNAFAWTVPPLVFLWGTIASLLLFAAASWYCMRALLPSGQRYFAWIGTLVLPAIYGMTSIFSFNEAFLTPRPYAEIACLLGVGLLTRARWGLAAGSFALALVLHPLQALGAGIIVWVWAVSRNSRWLHALWLLAPVIALAYFGIRPFDDLFREIDAAWRRSILQSTPQLFITAWRSSDLAVVGLDVLVLAYASFSLGGRFRDWCRAALIGLVLGCGATLLLADGLRLVLPTGLQLWRVHWLAHWFSVAAFALLIARDAATGERGRAALLMLTGLLAWTTSPWAWVPLAFLYSAWPRVFRNANPRLKPLVGWLCVLGMVLIFVAYAANELLSFRIAHYRLDLYAIDRRLLIFPPLALGLPLAAMWVWDKASPGLRLALIVVVLCPLVVVGAVRWDSRPVMIRTFEQHAFQGNVFGVSLEHDAQVYWDGDSLSGTWLVLQHASYFNYGHLAGQIFNRETAVDATARRDRLQPLMAESSRCQDRARPPEEREGCRISDASFARACGPGTTATPDYVVLPFVQPQASIGKWSIIDPVTDEPAMTYYLYRCTDVMEYLQKTSHGSTG